MRLSKEKIKRCAIFLFFDKDGIVDDYIPYMLRDLQKNVDYLLVMCNGFVNYHGLALLRESSDEVVCRANVGFDVGGYREGLFYLGWKFLSDFDEIVMMNYTFFGPVYPFEEMFTKMAERDVSFWGVTKHHKVDPDPFHALPYGYLPEHLQSHFLVVRKELFMSYQYRDFICNMENPRTYLESICRYEAIFTKYFSDLGFRWEAYVNTDEYEGYAYNPLMFYTREVLERKRCPIIKRRSFFTDYNDYLLNTCGESSVEMYEYLKTSGLYDLDLIWDNILRLENLSAVHQVLHLNYIADSERTDYRWNRKVAVVVLADSAKRCGWYQKYLRALSSCADVYLSGTREVCEQIGQLCTDTHNIQILDDGECHVGKQLARAASVLKEKAYDFIGIAHIREVEGERPYSNAVSWQYGDWENLFGNREIVGNVIQAFEENGRMGMCVPPAPRYGKILERIGNGWCGVFADVRAYLDRIGATVNMNENMSPLAPYGGSFWIRGDILAQLMDYETDVKEEVYLLALPFIVQKLMAYTGIACSDRYLSIETTNQDYMFRENNKVIFKRYGANYHSVVVERINSGDFQNGEG